MIEETLSPTWDELLVFDEVLVYGAKEEIKRDPPIIIIDIYDQDKVGKSEFIGRALARPQVKLRDSPYITPSLQWYDIHRGADGAGELLAAFEMIELGSVDVPPLADPKPIEMKNDKQMPISLQCLIFNVPSNIRPNLATFRIEVLFWGLRDLKRVHFMSVDKPRIDVECSGTILSSSLIQNAKKNPNFPYMLKFFDLELPIEEMYAPPITIRCVDCRSFGRYTLVGTHQITTIHKYMHRPLPKDNFAKDYKSIGGQILLPAVKEDDGAAAASELTKRQDSRQTAACENFSLYGAACMGKT